MTQICATRCKHACAAGVAPNAGAFPSGWRRRLSRALSLKLFSAWRIVEMTRQATCCKPFY
ncbi:hypothetical protein [Escherichia coli]|uniref:hypothetical protein n=1 Tax=Escherichia coli TaxID=562 RepID=UPI00034CF61E|nr:hypothetical protein [Escherichia coli]